MVRIDIDKKNQKVKLIFPFKVLPMYAMGSMLKKFLRFNLKQTERKVDALLIKSNGNEIEFYSFFSYEIIYIFKYILDKGGYRNMNIKDIKEAIYLLEREFIVDIPQGTLYSYSKLKDVLMMPPKDNQQPAFTAYENSRANPYLRGILKDGEPGTGKTYMSLVNAELGSNDLVVVVMPKKALYDAWVEGLTKKIFKKPRKYYDMNNQKQIYNGERYVLCHYEAMEKLIPELDVITKDKKYISLIVDEYHNFADVKSKRSKILLELCERLNPLDVIPMSGTPVKAFLTDLLVSYKLTDLRFNKYAEQRYINLYSSPSVFFKDILQKRYKEHSVKITKDNRTLPKLEIVEIDITLKNGDDYTLSKIRDDMKTYITERLKYIEEHLEEYEYKYYSGVTKALEAQPEKSKQFENYRLDVSTVIDYANRRSLYEIPHIVQRVNLFEKEHIIPVLSSEDKKTFRDAKSVVKYVALKVQGEVLAHVVMRARINCRKDIASTLDYGSFINSTTKKTVIFSNFIEVCETVVEKCKKEDFEPLTLYGNNTKDLENVLDKFNNTEMNPLVNTYKSGSEAVNFTKANITILIDLPFRKYTYDQVINRTHRLGQDMDCYTYQFRLDTGSMKNINERDIDILEWCKEQVELITGEHDKYTETEILDETIENGVFTRLDVLGLLNVKKISQKLFESFSIISEWK